MRSAVGDALQGEQETAHSEPEWGGGLIGSVRITTAPGVGAAFFQDEGLGVSGSGYSVALQREMAWLSGQAPYAHAQAIAA